MNLFHTYVFVTSFMFSRFSFDTVECLSIPSIGTKKHTQTNTVSWSGDSKFKNFWPFHSQFNNGTVLNGGDLFSELGTRLTSKNEAILKLQDSIIKSAIAVLNVKSEETSDKLNAILNFTIIVNTTGEILNKTKKGNDGVTTAKPQEPSPDVQNPSYPTKSELSSFENSILKRHNMYRKKHRAPPLVYSKKLSNVSQDWANSLAKTDSFYHRPNGKYGENLYTLWSSDPDYRLPPNAAVDAWYSEVTQYSYTKKPVIEETGHFTQLVWKSSKELGIGIARSKTTNRYFVVCNYDPPGNYIGRFGENVLPPT